MKRRCYSQLDKRFADYGGRGISVCDQWRDSYEAFFSDMGLPPSMGHQIDREDNDGNYSPENCRWITRKGNSRNKRNSRNISAFGRVATIAEWAEETGLLPDTISMRIARGWDGEKAVSKRLAKPGGEKPVSCPSGDFQSVAECARFAGMSHSGILGRISSPNYPDWRYK
ncbi:hypothetical protein R3F64_01275 [Halomonas sp. 5021]|uniref:hypothetical protein n=1 Tax=Halomonas sp. 5021 TaxID=3082156 RepID=UPI002FC87F66